VFEGVLDGLALGIEHGLFRRNSNLSFHLGAVAPPDRCECWAIRESDASRIFLV
jgi:hypothetical protein